MKNGLKFVSALTLVMALSYYNSYGQPPPNDVPLDPFSWTVLGAGAAIAGKKYYDARKKKKDKKFEDE